MNFAPPQKNKFALQGQDARRLRTYTFNFPSQQTWLVSACISSRKEEIQNLYLHCSTPAPKGLTQLAWEVGPTDWHR